MGYVFKKELEPVALYDDIVGLITSTGAVSYFKVQHLEPLPEYTHDFGSIAAGNSTQISQIDAIKLGKGWLGHYRVQVVDDIQVKAFQPKSVAKWAATELFLVSPESSPDNLTEFFAKEDQVPFFTATNPTDYNTPMARVKFRGFKYMIEEVGREEIPPEKKVTYIPIESRG